MDPIPKNLKFPINLIVTACPRMEKNQKKRGHTRTKSWGGGDSAALVVKKGLSSPKSGKQERKKDGVDKKKKKKGGAETVKAGNVFKRPLSEVISWQYDVLKSTNPIPLVVHECLTWLEKHQGKNTLAELQFTSHLRFRIFKLIRKLDYSAFLEILY